MSSLSYKIRAYLGRLPDFKSEVILNEILDIIERAIKNKCNNE